MFIQTEATPNPATLKFLPGKVVLESGTVEFLNASQAQASPWRSASSRFRALPVSISVLISSPSPRMMPNGSI